MVIEVPDKGQRDGKGKTERDDHLEETKMKESEVIKL